MITFKNVVKRFGALALTYDDYTFQRGRTYLVLGASGCGKTTLLNLIAGVTAADGGQIVIDGQDITAQSPSVRDRLRTRRIGYIYQDFKLIENMTAEDNIRVLEMCGVRSDGLSELAKRLEIEDKLKRKVRTLSGGEKQRVAIARALVKSPDILLADEPTGSLHFEIGEEVIKKLLECAKGKLLIAVSHDTRLAAYFDAVIDLTAQGGHKNV
ncbi:MAG: ATP-binding cassette domain-containing protein [Oscillospiraceae bacterium]|jgi:putative ABC transport system ATP-binding protein|nr:ATP-binding cassette domain-containing protein [Oscillospiraceae bacterium]